MSSLCLFCVQVFKLGPTESICVCEGLETDNEVCNLSALVDFFVSRFNFVLHSCILFVVVCVGFGVWSIDFVK